MKGLFYTFENVKNKLTENPYKLFYYVKQNIETAEEIQEVSDDIFIEIMLMVRHCLLYLVKYKHNKSLYQCNMTLLYAKRENPEVYSQLEREGR